MPQKVGAVCAITGPAITLAERAATYHDMSFAEETDSMSFARELSNSFLGSEEVFMFELLHAEDTIENT